MVASFPHDVRKTKPSNKKTCKRRRHFIILPSGRFGHTPLAGLLSGRCGPGPACGPLLRNVAPHPGPPHNRVKRDCVGWVTPGPRGGVCAAKRASAPGVPAQELALTKLMISPGVPGLPNKVRKSGVGCVGWVTPGPRGGACICEADERAWGPRTGVSAHKADDLARGPRLFERSENMWGGLPRQDGTYSGSERTSPRPPGFRTK